MENIKELLNSCVSCIKKPCQSGCPLSNDTTGFIKLMKEEKYKEAYELLCKTTVLQPICGIICPHSKQCQGSCIKRIAFNSVEIGKLEAYIGDMAIKEGWKIPKFTDKKMDKKIAVVGGGPAGLTCSAFLARNGYNVTIYEKYASLGGIMEHGIPDFRLNRTILNNTINKILELGIDVKYNTELGKDISLAKLEKQYDAIFLGIGANVSSRMGIEGEYLPEVLGGNELLENKNYPDFVNKNVAIIGGGNVAMDVCRTVKRLGAKKSIVIYRRSREEMPAEDEEIKDAINDGVEFLYQTNILKINGTDLKEKNQKHTTNIECIKTKLVKRKEETRLSPVNVDGSNFILDIDYVIMAVGSKPQEDLINKLKLETTNKGTLAINEHHQTSNKKVFAGGEIAGSKGTVAWAAKAGRDAAENIMKYLEVF